MCDRGCSDSRACCNSAGFRRSTLASLSVEGDRAFNGDSAPAPLLELVVQPSDWQKAVRRSTPSSLSADHVVYRSFWEPLRERLLEEVPELMKGRANPKSRWLTMVSPIPRTLISGEIGAEELLVTLDIDLGDRERNLAVLAQLQQYRAVIEADAGEVGFDEGKFRCRVVRSVPWEGTLLTQPERHDEARSWLHDNMLGLRAASRQSRL